MVSDRKYSAEVIVGITKNGVAELYDIVGIKSAKFEIKKGAPSEADSQLANSFRDGSPLLMLNYHYLQKMSSI